VRPSPESDVEATTFGCSFGGAGSSFDTEGLNLPFTEPSEGDDGSAVSAVSAESAPVRDLVEKVTSPLS